MKTTVIISRKTLLAINTFRSTDECRFVLQGICLEVTKGGKCRVLASDGRRFGGIEDGEVAEAPKSAGQVIIRLNERLLSALPASDGRNRDAVGINVDGSKVTFYPVGKSSKTKIEVEAMEGSFPKWRQIIPTGEQPLPIDPCFNWHLLDGFTKAARILTGSRDAAMQVRQKNDGAMLILLPSVRNFVGVLMPMLHSPQVKAPDWSTATPEE